MVLGYRKILKMLLSQVFKVIVEQIMLYLLLYLQQFLHGFLLEFEEFWGLKQELSCKTGNNIVYMHANSGIGIQNNKSRIRFIFLKSNGITTIPIKEFRFVTYDINSTNKETFATNCGVSVGFARKADHTSKVSN
jgi:hypothetical protein